MWLLLIEVVVFLSFFTTLLTVKADDCRKGFYGPRCWRRCKEHSHCLNNDCVLLPSGRALNCSQGCKPGWRGLSCNTNCKYPCIKCDRYTGECVGACRDGYHGDRCYKYCPQYCLSCEKVSGSCSNCARGFYGEDCSLSCPTVCEECDIKSGECLNRTNDDDSTTKAAPYNRVVEPRKPKLSDGLDRSELDSQTETSVKRSPITRSKDKTTLIITIIISGLLAIFVVLTFTLRRLFYKRKGRNSGLEEPDSKTASHFIKGVYEYPDTKYVKLGEECVSPSSDHVYSNIESSSEPA